MPFCADTNLGDPKSSQFTRSETVFSNEPTQSSDSFFTSELVSSFWDIITDKPVNQTQCTSNTFTE